MRRETWAKIAQVTEAASKKAGTDEKQKRECDLRDDQRFSECAVAAADDGSGFILESAGDIRLCGLKSGKESEENAGSERERA